MRWPSGGRQAWRRVRRSSSRMGSAGDATPHADTQVCFDRKTSLRDLECRASRRRLYAKELPLIIAAVEYGRHIKRDAQELTPGTASGFMPGRR